MSAAPLPAIPVTSQVAAATSPAPARASHGSDSTFGSHLQQVQRQQSASSGDASPTAHDQGDHQGQQQATGPVQANAQGNTQAGAQAKSTADISDTGNTQSDDSDDTSGISLSIPTSIGSLANTVLSLIDQATGDGHARAATNGKPAGIKQSNESERNQPQAAGIVPPLLPSGTPATATTGNGGNTGSNAGAGVAALAPNGTGLVAAMQTSTTADDADEAGGTDADAVNAAGSNAASTQGAGDGAQTFAGVLSAIDHAASTVAGTLPMAGTASTATTDLNALSGALGASAVTAAPTATPTGVHGLSVNAPVGSSGFAKELGQQVTWLSGQDIKQAQIKLNPQDLGPLDVKVSVEHGRVDIAFLTQHAATATAVQQGLDQLQQMLGGQGLSLGHTSVGQHASQQQYADQQTRQSDAQTPGDSEQVAGSTTAETLQQVAVGLVDAFA
jgi:flagellar hook-length control protein FliK